MSILYSIIHGDLKITFKVQAGKQVRGEKGEKNLTPPERSGGMLPGRKF